MRRVERERRQDREDDVLEVRRQLLAPLRLDLVPLEDPEPGLGELRQQVVRCSVSMASSASRSHDLADQRSCSGADRPSALRSVTDGLELLVRPETRIMKNSSRFEWKIARNFSRSRSGHAVEGLLEDAPVEGEPGELAVEVEGVVLQPVVRRPRISTMNWTSLIRVESRVAGTTRGPERYEVTPSLPPM